MKMLPSTPARLLAFQWYLFFLRLYCGARGAYGYRGWRGVAFQLNTRVQAARLFLKGVPRVLAEMPERDSLLRACHALFMGAPVILAETVSALIEEENLLTSYRAGVPPAAYVRERGARRYCVTVGSCSYVALLAWAWCVVNSFKSKGLL